MYLYSSKICEASNGKTLSFKRFSVASGTLMIPFLNQYLLPFNSLKHPELKPDKSLILK